MTYHTKKNKTFLKQLFYALSVVIMGLLLWGVKNYFFFKPESDEVTLGTFSQFKKEQILHKKKEHLFIIRDPSGLYALSDFCTHRGCMLLVEDIGGQQQPAVHQAAVGDTQPDVLGMLELEVADGAVREDDGILEGATFHGLPIQSGRGVRPEPVGETDGTAQRERRDHASDVHEGPVEERTA